MPLTGHHGPTLLPPWDATIRVCSHNCSAPHQQENAGAPPSLRSPGLLRSIGMMVPSWGDVHLRVSHHPHRTAKMPCRLPPDAGGNESPELQLISACLRCFFRSEPCIPSAAAVTEGRRRQLPPDNCAVVPEFDVPDNEFCVALPRRLRLPLPLAPKRCRCGGVLDALGNRRSACAQMGVFARRAGSLGQAAASICREAGAQVAMHVAFRDMNLDVFSPSALTFLRQAARARARQRAPWSAEATRRALLRRWQALAAFGAHASTLLELLVQAIDASDGAELPLESLLAEAAHSVA